MPIHPEYVASLLDDVAADDAVFTVDTGMCNVWAARYLNPNGRRRVIGSFAARVDGQRAAARDRRAVRRTRAGRWSRCRGDGGLSMLLGELITVAMHRLPVKIVAVQQLDARHGQARDAGRRPRPTSESTSRQSTTRAVAASLGIYSRRVEDPAEVEQALRDAFAHPGPALIDVVTDPLALSLPPTITGEQVKGFALAMSKLVMNEGVGEAVKMAKSNIRNVPRPSQFRS